MQLLEFEATGINCLSSYLEIYVFYLISVLETPPESLGKQKAEN